MEIHTRMCTGLDRYVTTPDGRPAQLADPNLSPESFGFVEFQRGLDAVLMGHRCRAEALERDHDRRRLRRAHLRRERLTLGGLREAAGG